MLKRALVISAVATCLSALLTTPALAADETWVSGVGDDVNPCTITAPCKTFAGAISKTTEGGVIRVLDPGGFGAVTITKSITIDASGALGSALASSVTAVRVNAGATDRIVLRGLEMTGGQQANVPCGPTMVHGVQILSAGSVQIEDARINLAVTAGVLVAPTANPVNVVITDSVIRNGCGPALRVAPTAGVTARVDLIDSTLSLNAVGIAATAGGTVRAQGTVLFGNGQDLDITGGSIDVSDPSNRLIANTPVSNPRVLVPSAGATRTWVSGTGSDANPCSRTAAGKTIAGAMTKTQSGGQINVLDGAELGTFTVTKPITIDGSRVSGPIRAAAGTAITVDVSAVESVVLRDLEIVGADNAAAGCSYPAAIGVRILNARSVHLENSTISGFSSSGLDIVPSASNPRVVVDSSVISNSCGSAIRTAPTAGTTTAVLVTRSAVVSNATAFTTAAGGSVWVTGSYLANNIQTSAGDGQVTLFPNTVEVVKEVPVEVIKEVPVEVIKEVPAQIVPVPQTPVSCKALPKSLRAKKTTPLLHNTCVTTGGQRVKVTVTGAGKAVKSKNGAVAVRTKAEGRVTVTLRAAATPAFLAYRTTRTYRLT